MVPDVAVAVDYLEILEFRELQGIIFTQTACQALQSKNRRYNCLGLFCFCFFFWGGGSSLGWKQASTDVLFCYLWLCYMETVSVLHHVGFEQSCNVEEHIDH